MSFAEVLSLVLEASIAAWLVLRAPGAGVRALSALAAHMAANAGDDRPQLRLLRRGVARWWAVAAVAAVALALGGRGLSGPPVPTIDEVPGTPVFAGAGWVVVGWMLTVVVLSLAISAKVPSARARLLTAFSRLGDGWALYPRSTRGAVWWVAVSLTAGCCEELVYRRLLPDLVTRLAGDGLLAPWVLSSLAFGLAHRSQGMRGMLVTGVLGAALFLLVAVTGTLWPAVAVHTIFDLRVVLNFALLGLVPPVPPVPTDRPAG